jgi:hypothetical protein
LFTKDHTDLAIPANFVGRNAKVSEIIKPTIGQLLVIQREILFPVCAGVDWEKAEKVITINKKMVNKAFMVLILMLK